MLSISADQQRPRIRVQMLGGGGGGCGISANEYRCVHDVTRSQKKLWISNTIFKLCLHPLAEFLIEAFCCIFCSRNNILADFFSLTFHQVCGKQKIAGAGSRAAIRNFGSGGQFNIGPSAPALAPQHCSLLTLVFTFFVALFWPSPLVGFLFSHF